MTTPSGVSPREWTVAAVRRAAGRRHDRGDPAARRPTTARRCCDLHEDVSEDTLRLRFFTANRDAGRQYVARLFDPEHTEPFALVALVRGRLAGLATAELLSEDRAEVAFLVSDQDRGRGLGSLLLEHLAALGREHGVTRFEADVLADNYGMLRVFRGAGFAIARRTERRRGVRRAAHRRLRRRARRRGPAGVALRGPLAAAAARARERRGGRRTPHRPGASAGPCSTRSSRAGTPAGCAVVHPAADGEGARSPACRRTRTCGAVPGPVDLVVVVVPPDEVGEVMADACAAGVGAAVVVSSGFTGELVTTTTGTCVELARAHSVRLVGPNSQGVLSHAGAGPLNATFARVLPGRGGLAVASQSGGVGFTLLDLARDLGVGVHSFVSLGAKLDVSSNDLLAAWGDDDSVSVGGALPRVVRQRLEVRPDRPPLRRAQAAARGRRRRPRRRAAPSASRPCSPRRG